MLGGLTIVHPVRLPRRDLPHAADNRRPLQSGRPQRRAAFSIVAALAVAGFLSWTIAVAVDRNDKDVFPPILPAALAIAAVALAVLFAFVRRSGWAFVMTALATVLWVAALFTSLYPRVMVSSPNFGNSLTVDGASSAHYTLAVMSVVAAIFVPLMLLYQGWTYHVFRGRVGGGEVAAPAGGSPAA